jgi:5-methylcytosine-specific restriction endonuclease McrA
MCDTCLASRPQPPRRPDNRPSRQARGYDAEYEANRAIIVNNARAYNLPCWKCGKQFGPIETITADHRIPLRKGGTNDLDNLLPACTRCNYGWRRARGHV